MINVADLRDIQQQWILLPFLFATFLSTLLLTFKLDHDTPPSALNVKGHSKIGRRGFSIPVRRNCPSRTLVWPPEEGPNDVQNCEGSRAL